MQNESEREISQVDASKELPTHFLDAPLDVLNLSKRPYNALRRAGIHTIRDLLAIMPPGSVHVRNLGAKGWAEVESALEAYLAQPSIYQTNVQLLTDKEAKEKKTRLNIAKEYEGLPLDILHLSTRAYRRLIRSGICTVGKLIAHTDEDLLRIRMLGPITLEEIHKKLHAFLENPKSFYDDATIANNTCDQPESLSKGLEEARYHNRENTSTITDHKFRPSKKNVTISTLDDLLDDWLQNLRDRERMVIALRYGLKGAPLTLEEIGHRLGVTRERIRQIQKRALLRLSAHIRTESLASWLRTTIDAAGGIMPEEEIAQALTEKLEAKDINAVGVVHLLCDMRGDVQRIARTNAWGLKDKPLHLFPQIIATLRRVLAKEKTPLPQQDMLLRFHADWRHRMGTDTLEDAFVLACARVCEDIVLVEENIWGLKKWASTRLDEIILFLRQLRRPAHYKEIATYVNNKLPPEQRTTAHNIHAQLQRYTDLFVRVGHGIYALAEWDIPRDSSLADAAYRVLLEAGQPLHIDFIADRVCEVWHVRRNSIYAAIQIDNRFVRVGRGIYYLRELLGREQSDASGIDFVEHLSKLGVTSQSQESENIDTQTDVEKLREMDTDFFA